MQKKGSRIGSYRFGQVFGYKGPKEPVQQEDVITALKFDSEGNYIALGDHAGRVIVFQNAQEERTGSQLDYFTEFQSHEQQFDPLKSADVEEAIVDIRWLRAQGKYLKMATTNARSIKLWKIYEKFEKRVVRSSGKELAMPKLQNVDSMHKAVLQKSFPDLHLNPIRQISPSFNEQYLLSADESQMFLWDMERPEKPYNVCDHACLKEDEGEEITCCEMHPKHDSIFLYGMSKGSLKVGDLRLSANVENSAVTFKAGVGKQRNILFDLISSVSSATFSGNSKYIVSRDYLTVKVWDICNSKKPLSTIILQEGLKSKLSEMLESESIYDQFQVSLSSDSSSILTGSYNNCFHLLDLEGNNCQYELTYKKSTLCRSIDKNSPPVTKMDLSKKVLASDFHPAKNMVAVAAQNCFFTYSL